MTKKLIFSIFIYILMIGCESTPLSCGDCYIEVDAPSLTIDENGKNISFMASIEGLSSGDLHPWPKVLGRGKKLYS